MKSVSYMWFKLAISDGSKSKNQVDINQLLCIFVFQDAQILKSIRKVTLQYHSPLFILAK